MNKETKSNIKIGVIALLILGSVLFGLHEYNEGHEASAEHGHSHD